MKVSSRVLVALAMVSLPGCWPTAPHTAGDSPEREFVSNEYVSPRGYVCCRAEVPIKIDGRLDDAPWTQAPWTDDFVDIEGSMKPRPRLRTRVKMLWDDKYFYIGAELEEPHVWGTLTEHDSVIFQDNDFEVFIDPDGDNHEYAEFEINALNTGWDLLLTKPYRDGGRALNSWEIPGLKTAVHVDGTLNDPRNRDRGWSIEIAFPWKVLGELASRPQAPRNGDQWRVNFSRVEWKHQVIDGKYRRTPQTKEDNWVWSPQYIVDMHRPETWGYVQFSTSKPAQAAFKPDPAGPVRQLLHRIYYAQGAFRAKHGRYASRLNELGIETAGIEGLAADPTIEVTGSGFEATAAVQLPGSRRQAWHIRQDSRNWKD